MSENSFKVGKKQEESIQKDLEILEIIIEHIIFTCNFASFFHQPGFFSSTKKPPGLESLRTAGEPEALTQPTVIFGGVGTREIVGIEW